MNDSKPAKSPETAKNIRVVLFEKDKGGVGSTGTMATVHYHLLDRGENIILVDAARHQQDILKPYQSRHTVKLLDIHHEQGAADFLDLLSEADPGSYVLVNIPGSSIEQILKVHAFLNAVKRRSALPIDTTIVWTMGHDAASRPMLDTILSREVPGRVLLNLPEWAGLAKEFRNVDNELVDKIVATGGEPFVCPKLCEPLYRLFCGESAIGFDQLETWDGMTLGKRAEFWSWQSNVKANLEGLF